ncbi:MAG: gluconolactonase [Rhodospirillales bacterium 70-18]|nr:SMP-30/gluconolactonase/LRE family protein [Rhodospirillales bacterium]OJY73674.1 MAG: gluconolactonase [Rhodospirillales bacterium 70-18]
MAQAGGVTVLLAGLTFPEGPRWHNGRLWFSDFYSHRVIALDLEGHAETVVEVPQQPSGLGWGADGALLIVSMLDRRVLRLEGPVLRAHADLSGLAGGPCNDMVVDAQGRAYVGNFGFDRYAGEAERPAVLVRVDPDGSMRAVAEDLAFPNGAVITPDGGGLILAETAGQRLTWFDIDAEGGLSGRRVFAQFEDCYPDGICLDAEGAVWVADARGERLLLVREGGAVARRVAMPPGRHAYACMLGGADRRTLFICSSTGSGPAMGQRADGQIDTVQVDVPGAGFP